MLKKEVAALLEQQINKEFYSAYLYLDMSNYYYSKNLDGFGNWFKIQAQEERDHAMLFLISRTTVSAPSWAPSTPRTRYMSPSAILWPPLWSTRSMSPPSSTPSMLRP